MPGLPKTVPVERSSEFILDQLRLLRSFAWLDGVGRFKLAQECGVSDVWLYRVLAGQKRIAHYQWEGLIAVARQYCPPIHKAYAATHPYKAFSLRSGFVNPVAK